MSALVTPVTSAHVRSGRFVQHERPAAFIPSRMRARRISRGAQFFGARARISVSQPVSDDSESPTEKLRGWILGRLNGPVTS